MKRTFFLLFLLLLSSLCFSQRILISGTAFDTTKGRKAIQILVNDTLNKFSRPVALSMNDAKEYIDRYSRLTNDTNYVVWTRKDGSFRLWAEPSDSLYFYGERHHPQAFAVKDLLKRKPINIQLLPQVCVPYIECKDTTPRKVYVFVAQKIQVRYSEPYYCNVSFISFDSRYKAEYRILKQLYGNYPKDTIRFTAFDHYGIPAFSKYNHVLLFIGEYCGELYHEKYQFFDVYQTADGKWASPGDPYKYDRRKPKEIRAVAIQFAESAWIDVSKWHPEAVKRDFPDPYYKIEDGKAIPLMGTYVDDLMRVKESLLRERKILLN